MCDNGDNYNELRIHNGDSILVQRHHIWKAFTLQSSITIKNYDITKTAYHITISIYAYYTVS